MVGASPTCAVRLRGRHLENGRYRTTVYSPASPPVAYRYLADFSSIVDWDPSVKRASLIDGQPGQIGARYRLVLGMPIRELVLDYDIVAAFIPDGPRALGRVDLRAENADLVSYDVITFTLATTVVPR